MSRLNQYGLALFLITWAVGRYACAAAFADDEGRRLVLPHPAQRIVSLSPGATAMLFTAGAGDRVVGTTEYSNEPEAAARIRRVGDSQSFDIEGILALRPDVVIVWSGGTSPAQIERLERVGLRVYRHRLTRLDDLPAALRRFGELAGTSATAANAASAMEQHIARIRANHRGPLRSTVLIQVWDRPIYTVGRTQLLSDVIASCGYGNVFGDLEDAGPAVGLESVLTRDPDVILALADNQKAGDEWLQNWRRYSALKAVRDGRLLIFSDPRLSRLGPGAIDAVETLCGQLDRLRDRA